MLGASIHKEMFQMEPTVLAIKLEGTGKGEGGELATTTPLNKSWDIFLTMKMTFNLNKFWYGVR